MIILHQPGERIMLQQTVVFTLHYAIMNIPLEDHPDHRRMRKQLYHLVFYRIVMTFLQHLRPESRSVQTVYLLDPLPYKGRTFHGTVHRQVATLGMSSDVKGLMQPSGDHIYIFYTVFLPRYRIQECHIKVFLPPHNSLIRAAECQKQRSVIQDKGNRRELGLPLLFHQVNITIQLHIPEASAAKQPFKQCPVLLFKTHISEQLLHIRPFGDLLQRHRRTVVTHIADHSVEFQIRKLA